MMCRYPSNKRGFRVSIFLPVVTFSKVPEQQVKEKRGKDEILCEEYSHSTFLLVKSVPSGLALQRGDAGQENTMAMTLRSGWQELDRK